MGGSYIEFSAFGAYCGEFIDELVGSDHQVFDISSSNDIFMVKTAPRNYPAIARKARAFRVKTRVVKRSGLYFTFRRYRKRVGIPLGMLAFFGIIVLMSNFVWSVKIIGNEKVGDSRILEQLEKSGISSGVNIHGFNANRAELELALAIEDLAWVSIERTGSRINVKVSERVEGGDNNNLTAIPLETPCNITSAYSGQLIRAEVYRGELLYEVGNGINAGDVVVSGAVPGFAGGHSYVPADA
ncbi:MAG: sporulation protein YqfD, partial [Oscillospiraceae bacterium]|nr:sporulation protein YqfD [Oscillospiraceae bacterium]